MENSGFIKQHPVLCYYILAFAISWSAVVAVTGPRGIPGNPANLMKMLPPLLLAMLAGPVVAAISVTGIAGGREGYRDYFIRLARWRTGIGWYGAAFMAAPTVFTAIPLAMALGYPGFVPHIFTEHNKASLLLVGFGVGVVGGIFEETGWTGFVIPRLRVRFDTLTTGVIVGFLWAAWHLLINIWSCGTASAELSIPNLVGTLIFSYGILPPFRVLMVFVWDRTGSVPATMLMHMTLIASNIVLAPTAVPGLMGIVYNLSLTAALWIIVAVCVVASRERGPAPTIQRAPKMG